MKNFNTVMTQVMQFLPMGKFNDFVGQHAGDKWTKEFTSLNQLSVMLYAIATKKDSLRDVETCLKTQSNHWYHLNLSTVARSTIADALQRRDYQIFESSFYALLNRCQSLIPNRNNYPFKFDNPLYSIDGSVIDLCLSIFDWAKFRKKKGAIKIHPLLNHQKLIPEFLSITTGKVSDITEAKKRWKDWKLPKESILTFDRGYIDYKWFYKLDKKNIYFVTRIKKNTNYFVLKENPFAKEGVISDQIIGLGSDNGLEDYSKDLRLIAYYDKEKDKIYRFITNNFKLSAKTIADIYKDRWQIELFFKWIKQNLKIKSFFGTSKNALLTQIWIAMIYYLILAYIKAQTKTNLSILELSRILKEAFLERLSIIDLLSFKPASIAKALRNQSRASPQMVLF